MSIITYLYFFNYWLLYSLKCLSIIMYFYSFNYWLLYNYTPYDLYFCSFGGEFVDWLVSDEDASCAAGVICFLYTTNV